MVFCKPLLNYYGRKSYTIFLHKKYVDYVRQRTFCISTVLRISIFFLGEWSWLHPILFILTSCLNLFCLMVVELLYTRMGKLLSTRGIVIIIRARHIFSCCYKPYKPGKVQCISLDLTKVQGRVNFSPLLLSKLG